MNTLPDVPDSVNSGFGSPEPSSVSPEPRPAYYGVIPAPVRYCKALPPAAKLLFTEITALCSVKGYCWASNAYFTDLYEVERYTVQRWLSALSKAGFIRVELGPGPGERRIYDLTITPPQKRDGGVTKLLPPRHKKEAQSIKGIKKESNILLGSAYTKGPGQREEKGSASPPSPSTLRAVERAVALTRDLKSRERFKALWEEVHAAGCPEVWQEAVKSLKEASALGGSPSVMTELFIGEVQGLKEDWSDRRGL